VRVVLDTNVVISGIFFGGVPRTILDHLADGRFEFILTPAILDEYHRTYARLAAGHREFDSPKPLLDLLAYGTLHPDPPAIDTAILSDPDDEKFMLCARDAQAIVVSGDQHLLTASGWEGIQVLTPRSFLDSLQSEPSGT
jgi:putative PIN family toxin of toxin-antitoxin system